MNLEKYTELLKARNYPSQNIKIIHNEETRKLLNYSYLGRDLMLSQKAVAELISILETKLSSLKNFEASTIELSLFSAFVMFYCKMFNSTSSGKIKLKHQDLYRVPEQIDIHEEIKKYRDAFLAHSGDYDEELAMCVLVSEANRLYLDTPVAFMSIPNFERLKQYENHLNIASQWLEIKSKKASESVWKSLGFSTEGGNYEKFF